MAFLIHFYVTVVLTILTSALTQCSCCEDYSQVMLTYCQSKRLPLGAYIWSLYHDVRAQCVHVGLLQSLHQIMILHIRPI